MEEKELFRQCRPEDYPWLLVLLATTFNHDFFDSFSSNN